MITTIGQNLARRAGGTPTFYPILSVWKAGQTGGMAATLIGVVAVGPYIFPGAVVPIRFIRLLLTQANRQGLN